MTYCLFFLCMIISYDLLLGVEGQMNPLLSGLNGFLTDITDGIGWIKVFDCTAEHGPWSAYLAPFNNRAGFINYAQYAVSVKMLPKDGQNDYEVQTVTCSNPVFNINNGYELSFLTDMNTGFVIGQNDYVNDWIGSSTAKYRLYNTCLENQGALPRRLDDSNGWIFHCCGRGGLHFTQQGGNLCRFNAYTDDNNKPGIEIWLGFDADLVTYCGDTGNSEYSYPKTPTSNPTSAPTLKPSIDPTSYPTTGPTIDPTNYPTTDPTNEPTYGPTFVPTTDLTRQPTNLPTNEEMAENGVVDISSTQLNDAGKITMTNIKRTNDVIFILVVVGSVVVTLALIIISLIFWKRKRKSKSATNENTNASEIKGTNTISPMTMTQIGSTSPVTSDIDDNFVTNNGFFATTTSTPISIQMIPLPHNNANYANIDTQPGGKMIVNDPYTGEESVEDNNDIIQHVNNTNMVTVGGDMHRNYATKVNDDDIVHSINHNTKDIYNNNNNNNNDYDIVNTVNDTHGDNVIMNNDNQEFEVIDDSIITTGR